MSLIKTPLTMVTMRYGLYAGIISIPLLIVVYYLGTHPLMIPAYLDFRVILFALFIFFALKEYRDHYHEGVLYYWQGMVGSYIIIFIASIIGAIGLLLFAQLDHGFVSAYIEQRTKFLQSFSQENIDTIGKEVYESNLKRVSDTNSTELAIVYLGQGILIGLFISIIISVILRKQPKTQ